jgi:uncharacterized membrane protein YbhN (UPF0104 family)
MGIVRVVVELGVVGLVVVLLVRRRGTLQGLGELLQQLRWQWVAVAIVVEAASVVALARLQRWLLRIGGVQPGLWSLVAVTLASNAIAISLPVGVALAEGYLFQQYRRKGADAPLAAWVELAVGAWSVAALAGLMVAGLEFAGPHGPAFALRVVALVVFVGATAAAVLFLFPRRLVRVLGWLLGRGRRLLPTFARQPLDRAERAVLGMGRLRPAPNAWLPAAGFAALNWVEDCGCLVASLLAVGGPVPWRGVLLAYAATRLLAELPITPGGVGIVEGGLVLTLVAYGGRPASTAAAVLVYRAISFWVLLVAGWVAWALLAWRRRAVPGPAAQTHESATG